MEKTKAIIAALSAIGAIVIATPVTTAETNVQSWLNLFGYHPVWPATVHLDGLLGLIFGGILGYLLGSHPANTKAPAAINAASILSQKISSFFNKGSISQTVNMGKEQRKLTDAIKARLQQLSAKNLPFTIFCDVSDEEALTYAMEIKKFLIGAGLTYEGATSTTMTGGDGRFQIQYDEKNIHVLVGGNAKTHLPLQPGPLCQGMGKI